MRSICYGLSNNLRRPLEANLSDLPQVQSLLRFPSVQQHVHDVRNALIQSPISTMASVERPPTLLQRCISRAGILAPYRVSEGCHQHAFNWNSLELSTRCFEVRSGHRMRIGASECRMPGPTYHCATFRNWISSSQVRSSLPELLQYQAGARNTAHHQ